MVGLAARGVLVIVILGVLGFLIGLLTGSTGASIGVLLGGVFVSITLSAVALLARPLQLLARWNPQLNLKAILDKSADYTVTTGGGSVTDGTAEVVQKTVGLAQGLGYWAVVLAALTAITWVLFRRRDIT